MRSTDHPDRNRVRTVLASATIVATAALVYRHAVSAYFFDDDFQWLVDSWAFRPRQLVELSRYTHFYRPIIELYFAGATPLFGGSPILFHLANIALHALNGLLLFALSRSLTASTLQAFLAALFFVVQPAHVDTICWVSALGEALSACFGCLGLLSFAYFRQGGQGKWYALTIVAFLLALLTHESSVMFFPLLVLLDWTHRSDRSGGDRSKWTPIVREYVPLAALLAAYLVVDLPINSRNYLVVEGHYRLGGHVLRNILDYIVALYVGKGGPLTYVVVAGVLTTLLVRGGRATKFAASWLVVTLLPFALFTWPNTARYLYLPAMGFSMLVATVVMQVDHWLRGRFTAIPRALVIATLATAIAGRFAWFANANVKGFSERTEEYRRYIAEFKRRNGQLPSYSRVVLDPHMGVDLPERFLNALVQWEYRDPTIQLVQRQPSHRERD